MKRILSDYYKHYRGVMISNIVLLICIPILCINYHRLLSEGAWGTLILILYIIAFAMGLWALVDNFILISPRLKKQLSEMPESERNDIFAQYPGAKCVNRHRYMEKHFVFFFRHRIYVLRYSDIQAAELKPSRLVLTVNGYKKPITMPFPGYGTDAVALAYLRNKNPDIKIIRKETTV